MRHYKQFLLFKNNSFELVRMNSLPFVNAKVPEKLKLAVAKEAKEQQCSQKKIVISALENYLRRKNEKTSC